MTAQLHPQIRALIDAATIPAGETGPADLEAERAAYLQLAIERGGPVEEVARVEDVVIPRPDGGRVRARAYWPRVPAAELGIVVWLHGGGWYVGDIEAFDRVTRQIANASGAICVSVDYRLAPEHRYPAAVEDARAAVDWATGKGAAQLGADPARVVVGGDSAGGNLAVGAARHARDRLRAQLLVYPALDAAMAGESYREFAEGPMLTAATMAFCWRTYLDGAGPDDPDASPLGAGDLAGLPPAYVAVAGHDPLRDDGVRYVERLQEAGVEAHLDRYDDMTHGFLRWGGIVDRSRELIAALGEFARTAIAAAVLALVACAALCAQPAAAQLAPPDADPAARALPALRSAALGKPWHGRLQHGVQLPAAGTDFVSWDQILHQSPNRDGRRWGTEELVLVLERVTREFRAAHPDAPPVLIGDLSRPRGGAFGRRYGGLGHASHQNGLDADVMYPRRDRLPRAAISPSQVDRELAQDLVDRFLRAGAVKLFVGPHLGLHGPRDVVVALTHHDDHVHVRIPTPPAE